MVCVGYVGQEAFDVILYLGRTITKLNKRVLIVDLSDTGALTKAISHGMDIDSSIDIVNYRDINYVRTMPTADELEDFDDGVVFIVFGYNCSTHSDIPMDLDKINVVVDTFPNHIDDINCLIKNIVNKERIRLLIRDMVNPDDVDRVRDGLEITLKPNEINCLYYNIEDYESAVRCQVSQVIRFNKISKMMENYLVDEIGTVLPDFKRSKIRKAVSKAKKGV